MCLFDRKHHSMLKLTIIVSESVTMAKRAVRRGIAVSMNDGRELASIRRFPYISSIFRLLCFTFACTVFFGAQFCFGMFIRPVTRWGNNMVDSKSKLNAHWSKGFWQPIILLVSKRHKRRAVGHRRQSKRPPSTEFNRSAHWKDKIKNAFYPNLFLRKINSNA